MTRDMARGEKDTYTDKQKRKAEHIADGYSERGVSKKEAKARAWATVNKEDGGGNKSGSGRGKPDTKVSARKGGRKAAGSRSAAERSAAAKKGWETRRKKTAKKATKKATKKPAARKRASKK
jgi:plasmid stabilization system protein ParE